MHFVDMCGKNKQKFGKTGRFFLLFIISLSTKEKPVFSLFCQFSPHISTKCIIYDLIFIIWEFFWKKFFWSHGTSLGSPGSLSQGDVLPGFCRFQILVIWGPYESPVLVACPRHSKSPKTARARCEKVKSHSPSYQIFPTSCTNTHYWNFWHYFWFFKDCFLPIINSKSWLKVISK